MLISTLACLYDNDHNKYKVKVYVMLSRSKACVRNVHNIVQNGAPYLYT